MNAAWTAYRLRFRAPAGTEHAWIRFAPCEAVAITSLDNVLCQEYPRGGWHFIGLSTVLPTDEDCPEPIRVAYRAGARAGHADRLLGLRNAYADFGDSPYARGYRAAN